MDKLIFEEYGIIEECAFKLDFRRKGIELYNREPFDDAEHILWNLVISSHNYTLSSFKENIGIIPYRLKLAHDSKLREQENNGV